ncbi:hypothetical protein TNCV_3158481 [Trichonephila clavipes]|nr:hypothetical protein TNCV_3158481 [Trichonephila clavipes]
MNPISPLLHTKGSPLVLGSGECGQLPCSPKYHRACSMNSMKIESCSLARPNSAISLCPMGQIISPDLIGISLFVLNGSDLFLNNTGLGKGRFCESGASCDLVNRHAPFRAGAVGDFAHKSCGFLSLFSMNPRINWYSCLLMARERHRASFDQVSEFDRGEIVAKRDCGLSFREIGQRVGRDQQL